MRPETRLGLAPASFAEQAAAANEAQARAMAQHYAALGGGESFSNKRVKLSDFGRGAGISSCPTYSGVGDFGAFTRA
jgi:hypothetical protein